ncbi:Hypothetical_protein [Hexamita inflata]|uniref:Hypothetical_protein n=1 Tax=Hexamita inflata TaxID=28002 RepID=A0AA86QUP0_9EUKA|nr:Hypothetical protein HINF_LOCUS51147 [Hexamita inflata]
MKTQIKTSPSKTAIPVMQLKNQSSYSSFSSYSDNRSVNLISSKMADRRISIAHGKQIGSQYQIQKIAEEKQMTTKALTSLRTLPIAGSNNSQEQSQTPSWYIDMKEDFSIIEE